MGRISAHVDHHFNEFQDNDWGLFGFFECEDDPEVAAALLDAARDWLRDRGRDRMVGPMDFTTNDECGLLIEGHERKPLVLEGWHHPYYLELLEGWGLRKAMDLYMWELRLDKVEDKGGFHPMIHAAAKKVTGEHGVTVRNMRRRDLDSEIARFLEVYNQAWAHNWAFVPLDETEARWYSKNLRPVLDENWTWIAERDGEVLGAALTLPDINRCLRAHERAPAAVRLGQVPLAPAQDRRLPGARPGREARVPGPGHRGRPLRRAHRTRPTPSRRRSGGARWAGSSRPTRP